jgi:Mg/Co/Ni transporter MgtE
VPWCTILATDHAIGVRNMDIMRLLARSTPAASVVACVLGVLTIIVLIVWGVGPLRMVQLQNPSDESDQIETE